MPKTMKMMWNFSEILSFPILLEYSKKLLDRIETMQPDEIAQLPYPIFILGDLSDNQTAIKAALIDLHSKYQTENLQEAQRKLTRFTSVSSHLIPSNVVELIASRGELKGEAEFPLIECLSKFIEQYKRMPAIPVYFQTLNVILISTMKLQPVFPLNLNWIFLSSSIIFKTMELMI